MLDFMDEGLLDEIPDQDPAVDLRDRVRLEMEVEGPGYDFSDETLDDLGNVAIRLAPSNYRASLHLIPRLYDPIEALPVILATRNVSIQPFGSLRNLALGIENSIDLYIMLHSRLFPVLRSLKIVGQLDESNIDYDTKLLRSSITR